MIDINIKSVVHELKKELFNRVDLGVKKPIYNSSFQKFLLTWFQLDIDKGRDKIPANDKGRISRKHHSILVEIQKEFDLNEITAYCNGSSNCPLMEIPMYAGMGVRLIYGANPYSGKVVVVNGRSKKAPFPLFQSKAIVNLDNWIAKKNASAGIIAIPTGGGKTYTMIYWLMKNAIEKNRKVLWVAHRHELLKQALKELKQNAYTTDREKKDLLINRKDFTYRIISGNHDHCNNIHCHDDIIIASKDSLNHGVYKKKDKVIITQSSGLNYLTEIWLKNYQKEIYFVIDEAHHASSPSYKNVIDYLKQQNIVLKIIGLTATPTRTVKKEIGLLKNIFKDGILYSKGLKYLIDIGFLSTPKSLDQVKTNFDMTKYLTETELNKISKMDFLSIGKKRMERIAKNTKRNHFIVSHYLNNKTKYGKTLIFALNVDNAIALNKLFRVNGVISDYVISGTVEENTLVSKKTENEEKIDKFRYENTEVLINYNILTEGVDLPKVQTVFLTRPTISEILMTQMIGRGLRGVKAGGTKTTNVVSFIDDWHDKIMWVSPKSLVETGEAFQNPHLKGKKRRFRLISIKEIEAFTIMQDNSIDEMTKKRIRELKFTEKIPVGFYFFQRNVSPNENNNSSSTDQDVHVTVYQHLLKPYQSFIDEIEDLFSVNRIKKGIIPNSKQIERMIDQVEETYFCGSFLGLGYKRDEIREMIHYYAENLEKPEFLSYETVNKFDIDSIAEKLNGDNASDSEINQAIEKLWKDHEKVWQGPFGFNGMESLKQELDLAIDKIKHPEDFSPSPNEPLVLHEKQELDDKDLHDILKHDPEYYKFLRDQIYGRNFKNGFYVCEKTGFKSEHLINFHIDHKIPRKPHGGKTELSNLQLIRRRENWIKGNKLS